jgi:hypothetical protein
LARLRLLNVHFSTPRSLNPRRLEIILDLELVEKVIPDSPHDKIQSIALPDHSLLITIFRQSSSGHLKEYIFPPKL